MYIVCIPIDLSSTKLTPLPPLTLIITRVYDTCWSLSNFCPTAGLSSSLMMARRPALLDSVTSDALRETRQNGGEKGREGERERKKVERTSGTAFFFSRAFAYSRARTHTAEAFTDRFIAHWDK